MGAAGMVTVTLAVRPSRSRSAASSTPTVTTSRTVREAPSMLIGSVVASVSSLSRLSGPMTSTTAGSLVILPTTWPAAGAPSIAGVIGTTLAPERSNASETVGGEICATWTPKGARTWSVRRWKSRCPARAPRRSSTATISPASMRLTCPDAPRTRTSTVPGGSPTISMPSGTFWNSSGTRTLRSTTWSRETVNHSNVASTTETSLRPGFLKGW